MGFLIWNVILTDWSRFLWVMFLVYLQRCCAFCLVFISHTDNAPLFYSESLIYLTIILQFGAILVSLWSISDHVSTLTLFFLESLQIFKFLAVFGLCGCDIKQISNWDCTIYILLLCSSHQQDTVLILYQMNFWNFQVI